MLKDYKQPLLYQGSSKAKRKVINKTLTSEASEAPKPLSENQPFLVSRLR